MQNIYLGDYKKLIIIPIIFLLFSLYLIFTTGIKKGIELKGGTLITFQTDSLVDEGKLQKELKEELGVGDVAVRSFKTSFGNIIEIEVEQNEDIGEIEKNLFKFNSKIEEVNRLEYEILQIQIGLENTTENETMIKYLEHRKIRLSEVMNEINTHADKILFHASKLLGREVKKEGDIKTLKSIIFNASAEAREVYKEKIFGVLKAQGINVSHEATSLKYISPILSEFFLQKVLNVIIVSGALACIVVILVFRSIIPSFAVLIGALSDIIMAMGAMALFNIPLSLPSLAALLMLIGFSLDTNLLLTIRVLKRKEGTPKERAHEAMKTGMTMSGTLLLAFLVLFVLSQITHIATYYQISVVAICGLLGDVFATWCLNAVIILWYLEGKKVVME